MNGLVNVTQENIDLLNTFIAHLGNAKESFRYFNHRSVDVIQHHLKTVIFIHDNFPVGYGHLDQCDGEIWLGIAILPNFQGKGIGHQIMDCLIKTAQDLKLNYIALTVDHINTGAIALYLKKGFLEEQKFESYTKFRLKI